MSRRITAYWTKWKALTELYGDMCFYCREEVATSIDHVLPYSYAVNNDIENLRPACALCNCLAGSKIFESVEDKTVYILARRRNRRETRHCSCPICGIPYIYREQSPSLFMCPECYDQEYGTHYRDALTWTKWLGLLTDANMFVEIYRLAGKYHRGYGGRMGAKALRICLIEAMHRVEADALQSAESKRALRETGVEYPV